MKQITRKELYTQVWSTPTRTLAAHYGLSDVGLAKILVLRGSILATAVLNMFASLQDGYA